MITIKNAINIVSAAVLLSSFSCASFAAVDMFLKIGDIKGESQSAGHEDEIDVLAWSWGSSTGSSGKSFKCNLQDLSLTKFVDSASPFMLMGQLDGTIYPSATLLVERMAARSEGQEYIEIRLTNARISSLSTGGSGGEDRLTENITINFSSATFSYTPLSGGTAISANIGGC